MVEDPVLGPRRIAKAPVVRRGFCDRLRRLHALQALRPLLPQPEIPVPPPHLGVDQRRGVGRKAPCHCREGVAQIERIRVRAAARRTLSAQKARGQPLTLRRDSGQMLSHVVFHRIRGGRVFTHRKPCSCESRGRACRQAPANAVDGN